MSQFAGWDLLHVAVNWEMAKVLCLEPEGQFVALEKHLEFCYLSPYPTFQLWNNPFVPPPALWMINISYDKFYNGCEG